MSSMPKSKTIATNGIELAVYEMGPRSGIPIVLCHGFPELAYSWRYQLPVLAAAGYHVIAPDLRGYGGSSRPEGVENYNIEHLTGDLVGLLDAFGIERAILAGHDWGGHLIWHMPLLHPTRLLGMIGLNTPFLPAGPVDPVEALRAVFGDDMYAVYFQKPGLADAKMEKDVARTFRLIMRTGIPPEELRKRPDDEQNRALMKMLDNDESTWPGNLMMAPDDIAVFTRAFEKTGFTPGINWYRNLSNNWRVMSAYDQHVAVPSLMIMAEYDPWLPPSRADGMENYVPNLEKQLIRKCGHWTQQEYPDEVNRIMLDWLQRHFPAKVGK